MKLNQEDLSREGTYLYSQVNKLRREARYHQRMYERYTSFIQELQNYLDSHAEMTIEDYDRATVLFEHTLTPLGEIFKMIRLYEGDGLHKGKIVYCPVNACNNCPYCDKDCVCHNENPMKSCNDFSDAFGSWENWESL